MRVDFLFVVLSFFHKKKKILKSKKTILLMPAEPVTIASRRHTNCSSSFPFYTLWQTLYIVAHGWRNCRLSYIDFWTQVWSREGLLVEKNKVSLPQTSIHSQSRQILKGIYLSYLIFGSLFTRQTKPLLFTTNIYRCILSLSFTSLWTSS